MKTIQLEVLHDNLSELREIVEGHRSWALGIGMSQELADEIASDLHHELVAQYAW